MVLSSGSIRLVSVEATPCASRFMVTGADGQDQPHTRDRVRAALINAGLASTRAGAQVWISPLARHTGPSTTDLAAAAAVLATIGHVPPTVLHDVVILGELGLDGTVRAVRDVVALVTAAADIGIATVVVPGANADEAARVPGVRIVAVGSLTRFVAWASTVKHTARISDGHPPVSRTDQPDLVAVPATTSAARFAVEVAAAGGHHLSLTGAGSGTGLLARSLTTLLPDLEDDDALQVTALHSAAGRPLPPGGLIRRPPLQAPDRSISVSVLVGAATTPGVVSLAHRGVLLLDDAPALDPRVLYALRQPLDSGEVLLASARGVVRNPARFQLILTSQRCSCGDAGTAGTPCCSEADRRRYQNRLLVLDSRLDIRVPLADDSPTNAAVAESSVEVAARVAMARAVAAARWAEGHRTNAEIPADQLFTGRYRLDRRSIAAARSLLDRGAVSNRGYGRILRLAWTISDLRGTDRPGADAVTAACDLYIAKR
ncbi:ATP-binding protein [Couchioplanes azureus]|uniref:ATP-binding protein n=1 Tax=Couchioplanes caeruleus TaxID=56438 RepID=UPI00167129AB|nr:ATP-binding protein [Couchioplanes caeruleus]GGQ83574.1 putative magnesium chelatase [Couchioplanes caeruleus subsp. azureus]